MTLAARLKERMHALGLTAADLARAVGVKPSSMSLWLNGTTKSIKGANLLRAAKALKVDAEWLATGKGSAGPSAVEEPQPIYNVTAPSEPEIDEAVTLLRSMSHADRAEALSFLRIFAGKRGGPAETKRTGPALSPARKKAA